MQDNNMDQRTQGEEQYGEIQNRPEDQESFVEDMNARTEPEV